ncbi:piggyBac transposable element-derived protein 4 [Bicyclus anynana]|uniref:PiggyBac transposable element-derived protein 4 n=1 Tax=Bicyclus anynana TaxID=110368 RepID=A0A6J1NH47_BICAN|nr:piggyBac transposable element-derived protein 4 [Bicyclus anynana]XP_052744917.1 piggyBac transposable element-derived protein 4 [Bicyclus anynana]XP_052744919.1 piggyBac transposable element-derived protein 4 [Bicyclus anynana]
MDIWDIKEEPDLDDFSYNAEIDLKIEEISGDEEELYADEELYPNEADSCYDPLPSPETCKSMLKMDTRTRDRSRSPIKPPFPLKSNLVMRIFNENGEPLDEIYDGTFFAPDAHPAFVTTDSVKCERSERSERSERRMSRRRGGRSRGSRGGRGASGVSTRGCGHPNVGDVGNVTWEVGHPLHEIWTTDADVPPELVSLARDVMRKRQARLQGERTKGCERGASEMVQEDEFFDACDGGNGLPKLDRHNLHFEWSPMETFQVQEEKFRPERTGSVRNHSSAYDAFRAYWDDEILNLIVTKTNQYASKIDTPGFQSDWCPTNVHEILCLFAFWIMQGIIKMPTLNCCFTEHPILKTEVFRGIFSRKRYDMLTRALHFIDSDPTNKSNSSITGAASLDPLHYLEPIISHLNTRFRSNYILDKDICIDETYTKQCHKSKATKGVKTFELFESATGYLWSFIVYSGKPSAVALGHLSGVRKTPAVVMRLMGPLLNKGYRLFTDWCSPMLARYLKMNGTDCVGTLIVSSEDVPTVIKMAPLKRGEYIARHSGDVSILSWQDKKRKTIVSTCHDSSTALSTVSSRLRLVPFIPKMMLDYNKYTKRMYIKDHNINNDTRTTIYQTLEPYLLDKRGAKWHMRIFKRLLNVSVLNSGILLQSSTKTPKHDLDFRLTLVYAILNNHHALCPQNSKIDVTSSSNNRYIISRHWPVPLSTPSIRCAVCVSKGKKKKPTPYCCESCRVPLCITGCFKEYHTPSQ